MAKQQTARPWRAKAVARAAQQGEAGAVQPHQGYLGGRQTDRRSGAETGRYGHIVTL